MHRPMLDRDGPAVAETFYKELFKQQPVDSSNAARALHEALKQLRAQKVSLVRWATFIHIGA
jgi:hypothetical protein